MRDFTRKLYIFLSETLISQGFSFLTFSEYLSGNLGQNVILRHDVDRLPENSLEFARIERETGIKGSYYIRVSPESWDEKIIRKISDLGHEIGYHYEDFVFASQKLKVKSKKSKKRGISGLQDLHDLQDNGRFEKELADIAIESFVKNLERLRKIAPVKTICMHGSPMSRWDGRLLWKYYDYHDFGIVGEPYFDVDFSNILYITDTGRRWNGSSVSVRDKAKGRGLKAEGKNFYKDWKVKPIPGSLMNMTNKSLEFQRRYNFKSTNDIIRSTERGELPDRIMMTFHPQRWTDKPLPWVKELVWQNVKNVGKYFLVKIRD